jgi:hypothetical protein
MNVRVENVPSTLKSVRRWLLWKFEHRPGESKPTKVPYDAKAPERRASSTDPATWADFETALEAAKSNRCDGIGFVLGDGFVGIDLDHVCDPASGEIKPQHPWATKIINEVQSYSEVSPSGDGLHILIRGALPEGWRKRVIDDAALEMYSEGRYFTVTGDRIPETPETVEERSTELARIHQRFASREQTSTVVSLDFTDGTGPLTDADNALLQDVFSGPRGEHWEALFDGDTSDYAGDQSRADLALCGRLARATLDPTQIDRIFRNSKLYRAKWDERHGRTTYGHMTIGKALTKDTDEQAVDVSATPVSWNETPTWPELHEAALYGLAGEVVRTIGPQSEGDPVAILTTFLAAFGNAVGDGPCVQITSIRHHANISVVHVGETAQARKGQGFHDGIFVMREADPKWFESARTNGLGSGEGLLQKLAELEKGNGETPAATRSAPRALVHEPELSRLLKVASRDGSTLSEIIRAAWDSGRLEQRVRKNSIVVERSHVSLVGQITADELRQEMTETDVANGFANRNLFVAVRRSKPLPFGGNLDSTEVRNVVAHVKDALAAAGAIGKVEFASEAAAEWEHFYHEMSGRKARGLAGALLARAEAQTLRLALIYALLDGSNRISSAHLRAAIALWSYAEESARYVFGDALPGRI